MGAEYEVALTEEADRGTGARLSWKTLKPRSARFLRVMCGAVGLNSANDLMGTLCYLSHGALQLVEGRDI